MGSNCGEELCGFVAALTDSCLEERQLWGVALESNFGKPLSEATFGVGLATFWGAAFGSCSPAMLPKLPPKLFSKAVAPKLRFCKPVHQNVSPKPFCKAAPESCAPKLLSLPPKVVSESGFSKLLSKATPQSCRSSRQLSVNAAAKPQSYSPTSQSCSPKHLCKAVAPKRLCFKAIL